MNNHELERRKERAQTETFIVTKTEDGYRVFSPLAPANQWLVRDTGDDITCTCPDFQHHADDPEWRCKHIIAAESQMNGNHRSDGGAAGAVASNGTPPKEPPPKKSGGRSAEASMLIKRSLSPDGRIDSLSVEFSVPVGKISSEEIKDQAARALKLQSEIMHGFVKTNGNGNGASHRKGGNGNGHARGAVPAQLLNIDAMDTKKGRSLFINVFVEKEIAKLFGDEARLGEALSAAGYSDQAHSIEEGMELNLPCRVVTKRNGRYLNIERLLPATNGG